MSGLFAADKAESHRLIFGQLSPLCLIYSDVSLTKQA